MPAGESLAMSAKPSIALVGLGEVGSAFAAELLARGVTLTVASRPSARAITRPTSSALA